MWIIFEMHHHSNEYFLRLNCVLWFTLKFVWHRGHIFVDTMSMIIFSCLNFVRLPQYNNVPKSWYHKVDTMKKTNFLWKGGLASCISGFIRPSKPIRGEYMNSQKTHKIKNLVLVAEAKNMIRINSGVIHVYTFFMPISKVFSFTPQGNMFIWKMRGYIKTNLSVIKRNNTIKFCQFQS